jgi:hypothetical protein
MTALLRRVPFDRQARLVALYVSAAIRRRHSRNNTCV